MKMYSVIYSTKASKALRQLDKPTLKRIKKAIGELAQNPLKPGTVKLTNFGKADYRFRVGNYRIMYIFNTKSKILGIADIKRRTTTTYS